MTLSQVLVYLQNKLQLWAEPHPQARLVQSTKQIIFPYRQNLGVALIPRKTPDHKKPLARISTAMRRGCRRWGEHAAKLQFKP